MQKLLLTAEEPETTIRCNKTFVPLYKAYANANISQAKAPRHLQIKCEYGNKQTILKTFIVNTEQKHIYSYQINSSLNLTNFTNFSPTTMASQLQKGLQTEERL